MQPMREATYVMTDLLSGVVATADFLNYLATVTRSVTKEEGRQCGGLFS